MLCVPSDQKPRFVAKTIPNCPSHLKNYLQGDSRTYTPRIQRSHRVSALSIINCKLCHANRCYKHILSTYNIHLSGALLSSLADITCKGWHALHQTRRDTYGENYAQIKTLIRTGSPASFADRLVYFASNFSPTTPVNSALSPGFYDTTQVSLDLAFSNISALDTFL